jgi:hypothetical protein
VVAIAAAMLLATALGIRAAAAKVPPSPNAGA